jgi:succinyl-CoA synthetase alpha subunit
MVTFVDEDTRLLVQGVTGHQGTFHTGAMQEFGTNVVAGVTPGKGGETVQGVPVYDGVHEAVDETDANTSVVYVPAPFTKDAVLEALDAGIETVVVITEHVPFHDAMAFVRARDLHDATIVGPNCPGLASPPDDVKVGIAPNKIFTEGNVAVVSRSGTLTYEIVDALSERGLGQSTVVGIGGDPVPGTTFIEALERFEADPDTDGIVLVGEIGGSAEEEAARYIDEHVSKPVCAYVAGRSAPEGKTMGHAGAIVSGDSGSAESKIDAFESVGVDVADFPVGVAERIAKLL